MRTVFRVFLVDGQQKIMFEDKRDVLKAVFPFKGSSVVPSFPQSAQQYCVTSLVIDLEMMQHLRSAVPLLACMSNLSV